MSTSLLQALPTPIGDGFTHLPTSVQFDPVMLAPPRQVLHCTLGLPPQHLREVHWPALVEECVARIRAVIARPTRVEQDRAIRRVGVMGSTVWERRPDGQYHVYEWLAGDAMADGNHGRALGMPELVRIEECELEVDGGPRRSLWLSDYARALRYTLYLQWQDHPLLEAYLDWVMLQLERRFWTERIQRRVRAKVVKALGFNREIVLRTRRRLAREPSGQIRVSDYNRVVWRRQHWPRLQVESPQWLALLAQLWWRLPTEGDPVANLRALLLDHGVSPAMWRLLHREGTHWTWWLRPYYTKDSLHSGNAAIELVLKAQSFGTRMLVRSWMLQALMNMDGHPNRPKRTYLTLRDEPLDVVMTARLGYWASRLWESGDDWELGRLQARCHLVFRWAHQHSEYVASRAMRQLSLEGLWIKVEAWDRAVMARAMGQPPWQSQFDAKTVSHEELETVELTSAAELMEETQVMRHCVDQYTSQCERGDYLVLSVRRKDTGKRLATVGVTIESGKPNLHQVAGFANSLVPPEIKEFALEAVECMRQQARREARRSSRRRKAESDAIRRAVVAAAQIEQGIGEFQLRGRSQEPRLTLCRSLAAVLRWQPVPRVRIRGFGSVMHYPRRVFERAIDLLRKELGYSPIGFSFGYAAEMAVRVDAVELPAPSPAGPRNTASATHDKELT